MILRNPMLAASRNLTKKLATRISYPKWVTDKEDGIRCLLAVSANHNPTGCTAFSRSLKPLPNIHIYNWAADHGLAGLDGEIVIPDMTFHQIQSWVMTQYPMPREFEYHVFDHMPDKQDQGYLRRIRKAVARVAMYGPKNIKVLYPKRINSPSELRDAFEDAILRGKEGLIVRDADGYYKSTSRCTFTEENVLKMKLYEEKEAIVVGFKELQINDNPSETSRLGYAKRSSHKANKRGGKTLGALVCRDEDTRVLFDLGIGFTAELRKEIWDHQEEWLGARVSYTHQPHGKKEKPRCPNFKGRRKD
jgi:DNA ligase-1